MKLKNKILSICATLLLSCQYAPAQAQIVDNYLNPTGVELTLCESIAEFAEDVSNLRQNGARYSDVIAVAPKPSSTATQAENEILPLLQTILYEAYKQPLYHTEEYKKEIITEFSKDVYLACIGG